MPWSSPEGPNISIEMNHETARVLCGLLAEFRAAANDSGSPAHLRHLYEVLSHELDKGDELGIGRGHQG